jgi:protein-S-isoprenylcysteine O-methyltransferase Ste14
MKRIGAGETVAMAVFTVLCIACFPINPLVLTGLVEPGFYLPAFILGWVVWTVGMVLVMAPIILFPRRGGVAKGQAFVHTTRLVDTGLYSVVRHPQYLGGILSIFITTPLLYPHWLFIVMGVPGILLAYASTRVEDRHLVGQFGEEYRAYMRRVPYMNLPLGLVRLVRQRRTA